jgi:hypothetical protein
VSYQVQIGRGRLYLRLWKDGVRQRPVSVHSLIAAYFIGPRPEGMEVNHRDGDTYNNAVENLEYVTPAQNQAHARELGLVPKGEAHGSSKLTEDDVRAIRAMAEAGCTHREIAQQYGVHRTAVSQIVRGETWTHVPDEGLDSVAKPGLQTTRRTA